MRRVLLAAGVAAVTALAAGCASSASGAPSSDSDMATAIALMIVILALGIVIDLLFSKADAVLRRRRGMTDPASA